MKNGFNVKRYINPIHCIMLLICDTVCLVSHTVQRLEGQHEGGKQGKPIKALSIFIGDISHINSKMVGTIQ